MVNDDKDEVFSVSSAEIILPSILRVRIGPMNRPIKT